MIGYHGTSEAFWQEIQDEGALWGRKGQYWCSKLMSRVTWFTPYPDEARMWGEVVLAVKFPKLDVDQFNREDDWQFTYYEPIPLAFVRRIQVASPIVRFFEYEHLLPDLQAVSKPIGDLARQMDVDLPDGAEKSAGLRKLLEAKDCLVRAVLPQYKEPEAQS